jgi:hypothetical protein
LKGKLTNGARLARAFPKFAKYISKEMSVTELLWRRDGTGDDVALRISSRDLDPAFEPAQSQETYGRGQDPISYEHGGGAAGAQNDDSDDGDEGDESDDFSTIAEAYQAMGEDGFSIQVLRHSQPRKSAPDWVLTSLAEFIRWRLTDEQRRAKYVPLQEELNFYILRDFYLEKYTDKYILHRYLRQFKRERSGSRWTCSAKAVKQRRERLLRAGDEYFDQEQEDDDFCIEQPGLNNKRGVFRRMDQGAGGFFAKCAVLGCCNQIEASQAISGVYICEQHPQSIQSKTSEMLKLKVIPLPRLPYMKGIPPALDFKVQAHH